MFLLNVESTFGIEIVVIAKDIAPNEAKAVSFRSNFEEKGIGGPNGNVSLKNDINFIVSLTYARQKWLLTTGDPKRRSSFVSIGCEALEPFRRF